MKTILKADHLKKTYEAGRAGRWLGKKIVRAVDDVSVEIHEGRTLGVAGESGCGKSTLARLLCRLERPDAGEVFFEGRDVASMKPEELLAFRRNVQVVFQDPMNSLNPRMRIGQTLAEPFRIHREVRVSRIEDEVDGLLLRTGLPPSMKRRYPHELSGGERQRVCIARAIALKPRLVICDEAVSSLDVLVRAQILNLLLELQRQFGLAYLFISHDLHVVRHMSDELAVMNGGKIVERGDAGAVFENPRESYTRRLLDSVNLRFGT